MNGELVAIALIGILIARELYGVSERRSRKVLLLMDVIIVPLIAYFAYNVIQGILDVLG
jgi:hypothetical protein